MIATTYERHFDCLVAETEIRVAFRIRRLPDRHRISFALSGELNREPLAELAALLERERRGAVALDLTDVTLVTRDAVEFIRRAEADGTELVNCPPYIRRWIGAEDDR